MRIILISANGSGAGKTTLANLFNSPIVSLADGVRDELVKVYPQCKHVIMSKRQEDKAVILPSGFSVRRELIELAEKINKENETHWCQLTGKAISKLSSDTVVIDDVRRLTEIGYFRLFYDNVIHFHLRCDSAMDEGRVSLAEYADYIINKNK